MDDVPKTLAQRRTRSQNFRSPEIQPFFFDAWMVQLAKFDSEVMGFDIVC